MRVALATWNGRISPVMDVAKQVLVVDIEDSRAAARREEALPGSDPLLQADRLVALGVQVLICGAISRPMAELVAERGVRLIPFTAGDVETVLAAWLAGALPRSDLAMPGCGACRRMRHGGRGGGRGRGAGAGRRCRT